MRKSIVVVFLGVAVVAGMVAYVAMFRTAAPDSSAMPNMESAAGTSASGGAERENLDPATDHETQKIISPARHEAITAQPRAAVRSGFGPAYGPVEQQFLFGDMLNDTVSTVLGSRSFDQVVTGIQGESSASSADRQLAYRIQIEDSLKPYSQIAHMDRFACAQNVCIGSIRTADPHWVGEWQKHLREIATLPMPTMSLRTFTLAPDNREVRFLFTTKPVPGGFIISSGRRSSN